MISKDKKNQDPADFVTRQAITVTLGIIALLFFIAFLASIGLI